MKELYKPLSALKVVTCCLVLIVSTNQFRAIAQGVTTATIVGKVVDAGSAEMPGAAVITGRYSIN